MSLLPLLSTFASTEEALQQAIEAGVDHIILEDAKVSVRSYADETCADDFSLLPRLAEKARQLKKNILLSFNADLMVHDKHFPLLEKLCSALREADITVLRVQDPGLIGWMKKHAPQLQIHVATETGSHNMESWQFYDALGVTRQTFPLEVSCADMTCAVDVVPGAFEVVVQGPILLQYTRRRLMAGYVVVKRGEKNIPSDEELPAIAHKYAQDTARPGRFFPFYDNRHGHFMYFWADRCLLKYMPQLLNIKATSWLIDGRGEKESYVPAMLKLYRSVAERCVREGSAYMGPTAQEWAVVESVAQRPQKAGFFISNRTDYVKRRGVEAHAQHEVWGSVVDVVKGHVFVLELCRALECGQKGWIIMPDGKKIEYVVEQMWDMQGRDVKSAVPGMLIKLPWAAKVVPRSQLVRISPFAKGGGA